MFLDNYIEKIERSRQRLEQYVSPPSIVPNGDGVPNRVSYALNWSEGALPKPEQMTVEASRNFVTDKIDRYFESGHGVLLLTPNPGQGKSTTAIRYAQKLAAEGKRVLYLMPRHDYWLDIQSNPFTKHSQWYHWLSVDGVKDEKPMCRYAKSANAWARKGYKLIDHCKALCGDDGYIDQCAYRRQRHVKQPIVAGVHNHLTTGMAVSNFDAVFIDELPIGAFVDERFIKAKFIDVGARGKVRELTDALFSLCAETPYGVEVRGEQLLSRISHLLPVIYENTNLTSSWLPMLPEINDPKDVFTIREWYIYDLLLLLMPEFYAYKAGKHKWMSRVVLTRDGLKLLQKKELWEKLPEKIVIMDGTGDESVYETLFNTSVTTVNPEVKRQGRMFQIAERSYTITSVMDRSSKQLKKPGKELMELVKLIETSKPLPGGKWGRYENIGIVTFKKIRHHFDSIYGSENVLHFGGNRGTNAFVGKDCVMVLGTPSPPDEAMIDLMAQLSFDMSNPEASKVDGFAPTVTPNGVIPVRSVREKQYLYSSREGMTPARATSGFWLHPDLQAVYEMFRAGEIQQSGHRGRPLTADCDVWLVTAVPTNEWLDGLWESPNECLNLPREVHWSRWPNIEKWLRGVPLFVSVSDITEREGVSRQWAAKWARSIAEWRPYEWAFGADPNHDGKAGRPKKGLIRISP